MRKERRGGGEAKGVADTLPLPKKVPITDC
jgi:hypothetical protein